MLRTSIDLDGLYDILELKHCSASWAHAEAINRDNAPLQPKFPTRFPI